MNANVQVLEFSYKREILHRLQDLVRFYLDSYRSMSLGGFFLPMACEFQSIVEDFKPINLDFTSTMIYIVLLLR